ncbi:MAG: LUD domain-containing protein [Anaerolineales bacterium]|nr:LUD domain-containing protein [Anaerolineales bacterium]
MPSPFQQQIQHAIKNESLQSALDKNAANRARARESAYQSLSEPFETLRQRAHRVREDIMGDLPTLLSTFIDNAEAGGFTVHRAADTIEAQGIILNICREHRGTLVAKSKSMVSEEIKLNPFLESKGVRVVETDLGEYIVQLRDERPSHIITPAVHLQRSDVGKTFQEKLGIPYTENVSTLTNAARKQLRDTFLKADIGISGVNFGIARSGSLCIVTNEGNGRMVTSLPPVHIALMGQERLVRDLNDLALMLSLLPRSATGQKMTVYTQILNGPRLSTDPDQPQERHLIILDNGRSALRDSSLREALLCIRCGACLNACPVFQEIGGHAYVGNRGKHTPYPGPIGSIVSPGLFGQKTFGHLAQASTLCEACYEACPVKIDLPKLLLRVRAGGLAIPPTAKDRHTPAGLNPLTKLTLRMFTWLSKKGSRFHFAQKALGKLGSLISLKGWIRMPDFTGWGISKDLLQPAKKPFRDLFPSLQKELTIENEKFKKAGDWKKQPRPDDYPQVLQNTTDQFRQELEELGGHFIPCSPHTLPERIFECIKEQDTQKIFSWKAPSLLPGVLSFLQEHGINIVHQSDPEIKIGLTGAQAGIAETGTLLLTSGKDRPATASLLPPLHLAVLDAKDIHRTLSSALGDPAVTKTSTINLISGPSRTADIEMTLDIGVHGPREVFVFCLGQ